MICYEGNLPAEDTINKILKELTKNQNDIYLINIDKNITNDKIKSVFINIELDEDPHSDEDTHLNFHMFDEED